MASKLAVIGSAGIGAVLMYILDPERGRRRRAIASDQVRHLARKGAETLRARGRDAANRARGLVAEAQALFRPDDVDDRVLEARVRSELGRYVSHPGSIDVSVDGGRLTVAGPVLANEVDALLAGLCRVRGIRDVASELEPHDDPGTVPGLQGSGGPVR